MEALISTFHIDWKLMIAQIINFLLVFLAIYFLAAKPIRKVIEERTSEIEVGLLNGEKNKEILANTKKEYDLVLAQAKQEADNIMKQTKQDAETKKNEMLFQAQKEVELLVANGKKSLADEKDAMMTSAKKEIANLVIATTEKVLGSKIDSTYTEKAIKELNNL